MKSLDVWVDEMLIPYWNLARKQYKNDYRDDWADHDRDFYLAPVAEMLRVIDDFIDEKEKKKFFNVYYYDGLYSDEDSTGVIAFSPVHALIIVAVENVGDLFFEEIMHGSLCVEEMAAGKGKISVREVGIKNKLIRSESLGEVSCRYLLRHAGWRFDGDIVCLSCDYVIDSNVPVVCPSCGLMDDVEEVKF